MPDLKDKVVWVIGASTGIGRATALELARAGARLALTARSAGKLEELVREIGEMGEDGAAFPGDVTDAGAMDAISKQVKSAFGSLDVLFYCAGAWTPTRAEGFDGEECAKQMRVNYEGMLYCLEAVLPGMLEQGEGYVVGVSSLTAYRGLPTAAAYCATKAAITSFLESLRFDLERRNIPVTIVSPGFVKTPLTDKNAFEMPFLMEVDDAARIIVKGMKKGKMEIHFPKALSWPMKLMRILPYPIYAFMLRRQARKVL